MSDNEDKSQTCKQEKERAQGNVGQVEKLPIRGDINDTHSSWRRTDERQLTKMPELPCAFQSALLTSTMTISLPVVSLISFAASSPLSLLRQTRCTVAPLQWNGVRDRQANTLHGHFHLLR